MMEELTLHFVKVFLLYLYSALCRSWENQKCHRPAQFSSQTMVSMQADQ